MTNAEMLQEENYDQATKEQFSSGIEGEYRFLQAAGIRLPTKNGLLTKASPKSIGEGTMIRRLRIKFIFINMYGAFNWFNIC